MHDANGTELHEGDIVLIPAKIETLHQGEDYCNVTVKTTKGRRPDGLHETITLNTGVVLKADESQVLLWW